MEPTSILTGVSATMKAYESITKLLTDADKLAPDDARYYATYLEVARQAIKGIEEEYVEILIEAAHCQLNVAEQKEHLLVRIDKYIHGEVLRPKLREAIDHLRAGREALQQHAERLLIWPNVKRNRMAALEQFDRLLNQLEGYLGTLGGYTGPSAVALDDIKRIETATSGPSEAFVDLVEELLMNLDKSRLLSVVSDCSRVIEVLRITFR